MIEIEKISDYKLVENVLDKTDWLFVIKSQDQVERREKLLLTKKNGKFGRISKRPNGNGLLVSATLSNKEIIVSRKIPFVESRHIIKLHRGGFLLTSIDTLFHLDKDLNIINKYSHELFAFLHTVRTNSDESKYLVVSSGYDSIFELNTHGEILNQWLAWENGFNPDEDGNWLALNPESYKKYISENKKAKLIDPKLFGKEGLATSIRSAHPNLAIYNTYDEDKSVLISIGHFGDIYKINFEKRETILVNKQLSQMPHGLYPYLDGWCITNTTKGEFWIFNKFLEAQKIFSFKELGHKIKGTENIEWIQQIIPIDEQHLLALDANRGLIAVNLIKKQYSIYYPDPNWCFQDALFLNK